MRHGFAIDTRSCIGCHACSTACKSENAVPLGVNRTWVRYTETGRFPDTRRSFQVTRCNHCDNPPCARICPVAAMYRRADGIVEFDSDACIGCKGCLQACPYDAIYVDPDTGTAAKCHFCGHRVTQGLEPACVVVCPTHSILAGDLDDPKSEIARFLAKNDTTVRKPEQGTAPKLFYVSGTDVSLHPTALERPAIGMMTDVLDAQGRLRSEPYQEGARYEVRLRFEGEEAEQGLPAGGPIAITGNVAGQMVAQTGYTAFHKAPWHWQVPAYLVTKAVGAGALGIGAVATLLGWASPRVRVETGLVGLLGLVVTTALLVGDLERPERFLRILTRPQWRSWLTRGAFLLVALSLVATVAFGLDLYHWWSWRSTPQPPEADLAGLPIVSSLVLPALVLPLAASVAAYTAFLFAQCEGRDLWQSPVLPAQLLARAAGVGGAVMLVLPAPDSVTALYRWAAIGGLAVDLLLVAFEYGTPHASETAAKAARMITRGRYAPWFRASIAAHLAAIGLLAAPLPFVAPLAAVLALAGLYAREHAFVAAPQEVPNS